VNGCLHASCIFPRTLASSLRLRAGNAAFAPFHSVPPSFLSPPSPLHRWIRNTHLPGLLETRRRALIFPSPLIMSVSAVSLVVQLCSLIKRNPCSTTALNFPKLQEQKTKNNASPLQKKRWRSLPPIPRPVLSTLSNAGLVGGGGCRWLRSRNLKLMQTACTILSACKQTPQLEPGRLVTEPLQPA
jgi:hypothetical protein